MYIYIYSCINLIIIIKRFDTADKSNMNLNITRILTLQNQKACDL